MDAPPVAAPAPWQVFAIMFVVVGAGVVLIVAIGGLSRWARGLAFWPAEEGGRPSPARGSGRRAFVRRRSAVRERSEEARATLRQHNGTFAGSVGSGSRAQVREQELPAAPPAPPAIAPELPQTMDELTWALAAVRLRTSGEAPTKEAAILRAFPHVSSKGSSAGWRRASALYDVLIEAQKSGEAASAPAAIVETV